MADHHEHHHGHGVATTASPAPVQKRDPVCGMVVDPATSKHRAEHDGARYHFCSAACRAKFLAEPAKYLKLGKPEQQHSPQKDVIYTCPMHPQFRRPAPGNCPICGMTLEPVVVSADTRPSAELIDMTRRLWVGAALAMP